MQIVSWKSQKTERGNVLYWVTLDGRILGDSRPFDTAEAAKAEALAISDRSIINGIRSRVYRPGF